MISTNVDLYMISWIFIISINSWLSKPHVTARHSIDVNFLLFKFCDAIEYQFLSHNRTPTYSGQEIQLGTKKLHANWLWKIDPHFLSPKIFLPHRQESIIGVKKLHINCASKMEVYCMNWVSLNRRLLGVQ